MKTIRENTWFFGAFAAWLVAGAIYLASSETADAVFYWSAHRSAAGDLFFRFVTHLGEGVPYFAVIFLALLFRFRHAVLVSALGLTVMAVSNMAKALFAQPRPAAVLRDAGQLDRINLVEGVDLHFAATSFPSGHAMGAFALCAILAFLIPYKRLPALALFLLALSVAVSRVYLVQHFFKDVYAGSILGLVLAMVFLAFSRRFPLDKQIWYNKGIQLKS